MRLQFLLPRTYRQLKWTVGNSLAKMDPLADYFVDGDFLVSLCPFSGDCGREQLFQEVVDRLEQDHM